MSRFSVEPDIVEVVGKHYSLRRIGSVYKSIEHDSLVVNPDTNWFHWNSRGVSGGPSDFISYIHGVDRTVARDFLRNSHSTLRVVDRKPEKVYQSLPRSVALSHHKNLCAKSRSWWHSRGVLDDTIDRLLLGTTYEEWSIERFGGNGIWYTIPSFSTDGDHIENYKIRTDSDADPKYLQYKKDMKPVLYVPFPEYIEDTIVFVAGEIKAMVLGQYGIPAVSSTTGCATWRSEWVEHFAGKRVIQCFDAKEYVPQTTSRGLAKHSAADLVMIGLMNDAHVSVEQVIPPHDIDDALVKHGYSIRDIKGILGLE